MASAHDGTHGAMAARWVASHSATVTTFVTFGGYRVTRGTPYIGAEMEMPPMTLRRLSPFALVAALLPACDAPNSQAPDASADAVAAPDASIEPGSEARRRFRDVFETQRFHELPAVLDELRAANAASPHDHDTVLTIGLAGMWGALEWRRDPSQGPLVGARMTEAIGALSEAMALRPGDHRINGWLGPLLIGASQQTGDANQLEQGLALLSAGVAAYPEFNLFSHSLVFQQSPVGSAEFQSAIDAYYHTLDVCFGPVDPANPDITPYLANATTVGVDRVCWNGPLQLHNFEGYFLSMGDALAKAGRVPAARVAYTNATRLPSYETWPYRTVLADRLATLGERAALYADADPTNDPPLIAQTEHQCGSCHARTTP